MAVEKAVEKMDSFEQVPIETVARYWNERPCNVRHSPKEVGGREYFDEVENRKYFVEPHIPGFADFEKWRGKKVLEIGCGIGTDTMNFARHGAEVVAVDLSIQSLELAKRRADVFGLKDRITFVQANAEELTAAIPAQTFDLVYSFGVIHHTPHPDRVLDAIKAFVGSGSVIKIMMYHRRSWKVLWVMATAGAGRFWRLREIVAKHSEAQTGCPVTFTYSANELRRLLEQRGWRVEEVLIDHIFPYEVDAYRQYRYKKNWYFRWMPKRIFRWLEMHFGWHLCATARVP